MLFFLLCLIFHARCFSWSFNCCKLFATSPNFPSPTVQSASIPERRGLQPVAGPICSQNPKMQAALVGSWRPHHLCLCVQELPDTQPGEHRLPAASCSSLVPKLWLLHPWQHVLQRGKCPGSRGALLKPGLKALVTPRARMNWTALPEHHFLHPRRFIEAPHESPSLTEHPPPRQRCPPHLSLC